MNKKQYLEMRKNLMQQAQQLINEGKAEEAEKKMEEVTALDNQWDQIIKAAANFEALNKEPKDLSPVKAEDVTGNEKDKHKQNIEKMLESEDYKNAWAKTLMGKSLSAEESKTFTMVNEAFTHNTENTSIVIPKTVTRGIWEMAGEIYPYFADVTKTYVNGVLSMIQEDTSTEAKWYVESIKTEDGKETFKEFQLTGCELSRAITVSWKLKEMSIEDFIPYIQRKMARKMGSAAGYGATYGAGPKGVENNGKPEPTGTVTALLAENGTPQVVKYANGTVPTYTAITSCRAKVKSGYASGLKIYANNATVWNKLANVLDANKRPIFIPDPTGNGVFRILGMEVKEDDSMKDGDILISNPSAGYHMNINKEISMATEDHVKDRKTDYCGYAIMDGNIVTSKAHALLTEEAAQPAETK